MPTLRGMDIVDVEAFAPKGRRARKEEKTRDEVSWTLAKVTFHGGRNETFMYGPTPPDVPFFELDLEKAYVTALSLYGVPDWKQLTTAPS